MERKPPFSTKTNELGKFMIWSKNLVLNKNKQKNDAYKHGLIILYKIILWCTITCQCFQQMPGHSKEIDSMKNLNTYL